MMNHSCVMGRLTRDPELRKTANGVPVASFSLAVERDYDRAGQREVDFLDCVAWRSTAEFVSRYFRKGSAALVEARIRTDKWIDSNTDTKRTRYTLEVERIYFAGSKPAGTAHENQELPPIPADDPLPLPEEFGYAAE